jgi:thioredoxin-related protein
MRVLLFLVVLIALAPAARAETVLLMLEEKHCSWCALWDREVGEVYPMTDEGRAAPLLRHDIQRPLPDWVRLARRPHYTPTFVLLRDGAEVGRIEGYPGEEFFYGLLQRLLQTAPSTMKERI